MSSEGGGDHGGGILEFPGRELARESVEQNERVPLVPRHALGRELGLCPELSTETARWQPRGWPGWRGERRGDPARGKEGGVESGRDAWVPWRAGGGLRPSTAVGGTAQRRRR